MSGMLAFASTSAEACCYHPTYLCSALKSFVIVRRFKDQFFPIPVTVVLEPQDSPMTVLTEAQEIEMNNSVFWPKYLEGVFCTFPRVISPLPTHEPVSAVPSVCMAPLDLARSIHNQDVDLTDLYLAAWAVLLQLYVGEEQVCFGVAQGPLSSLATGDEMADKSSLAYTICKINVENAGNGSAIVVSCRASLAHCLPYSCSSHTELFQQIGSSGQSRFNTAVYLVGSGTTVSVDTGPFGIALIVRNNAQSGPCQIHYSSSLLSDSAATLIASNYQTIVSQIASNMNSPIGQLPLVSKPDLERTWSWNQSCPPGIDGLVHEQFARKVLSQPHTPAVCASDASFTYQELDALSNVLANFLARKGVGPETVMPLCFTKSAWATVSMLAVIKAGGAFTFLDPSFPIEVLQDVLGQTGAKFLLCADSSLALWDNVFPAHAVSAGAIAAMPQLRDVAPQSAVHPTNLLYIVFTSGSTGKPKGVCVEHSGFLSSSLDFIKTTGMNSSTRVLHFASYTFDASIFENFTALLCGGCVCIPDEISRAKGVPHFVAEFSVNLAFLTPSLVKSFKPEDVPSLKTLVLMGEAPTNADLRTWAGKVKLMNAYGPSECCVASSVHTSPDAYTEPTNIGWPVGGLLWVVDPDDHNHLVPIGAVGELAIEGPHLGRGYLNDEAKTAKAFVDSPQWTADFSASRKRRVYMTGDIVRRNMDGSIVFIKRKDTQVKVRGMRMEIGAVERHLSNDPLVKLATVLVPTNGLRKGRLVAVVSIDRLETPASSGDISAFTLVNHIQSERDYVSISIRDIRDRLQQRLPRYMVPSAWFVLESFPLMRSGKIDRRKVNDWISEMDARALDECECLLDQDATGEASGRKSNDVIDALRREIGLVLNLPLESVAPWKSFISLGGDSISVLQLMSQCRALDMVLTVHEILKAKSVNQLALQVKSPNTIDEGLLQMEAKHFFDIPFGLSPIQQLFFYWEPEGSHIGGNNRFNQSFLLRVKRPVSLDPLQVAFEVLVERHPMLRGRFVKSSSSSSSPGRGPGWEQIIPSNEKGSFRLVGHNTTDLDDIQSILLRSQCAIDMISGLVFIVDLITHPRGQLLSLIAHHAVIDLVSWRVIIRELESLLEGGESATLPPQRSLSWPAWCKIQADYASQHLSPRTALPNFDNILPPDLTYWGMEGRDNTFNDTTRAVIHLDFATTSLLMEPERHQILRTEPIDLFLSAIIRSFTHTFSDRKAPTVFRESHGRESWSDSIDISSTVGWFTTMYPILMEEGSGEIIDTIRRVKDAQRRVPKNGWPYFASTFQHPDGVRHSRPPTNVEIIFDFLGLYQQLERSEGLFEQESSFENLDVGPEFHRPALFEVTAEIIRGQLNFTFEYNKTMRHRDKITSWIELCEKDLSRIVAELGRMNTEARRMYTLSDFPLLHMGYESLDNLFDDVVPGLGISEDNIEDLYDTSPMQTGMLISQLKDPALYQCSTVFQVDATSPFATVDVERLNTTWKSLVQRHSTLRTVFIPDVSETGAFCQIVLKTVKPRIAKISCLVGDLDAVLKQPTHLPLHDGCPPHRLTICDVSDGRTFIRLDINHACIDGASGDILARDFVALYDGNLQLPEAPAYRDFVSKVQNHDIDKSLQYWKDRLDGVEPCHLPILDDGIIQDGSLQTIRATSPVSVDSLNRFCRSHNVTLPTVFMLAWSLVLRAYTGSDAVCFGYLVSGRDNLDANGDLKNNTFGALANVLACCCDLSNAVEYLLKQIYQDSLSHLDHQYCPLAHIQGNLDSERLNNKQGLFNTILNFQIRPVTYERKSAIQLREVHLYEPTEYSCAVDIVAIGERLEISLTHWTSSMSRGQASNIAETFMIALESLTQSPAVMPAKKIDVFGEAHSKQIWGWNYTVPPRVDMCIHDVFSHNAIAYSHASAIESWDALFTYKQLDEATTKLGRHLAHLGVGPGSIVPLCFVKSAWAIVALLAVLKAGGAFVLLDPNHVTPGRTGGIIRNTGSKLLVTGGKEESMLLLSTVDTVPDALIVNKDFMQQIALCPSCTSPSDQGHARASPRDPAYIFFTSGTTGTPKGSINTHSGFCTAAASYWKRVGMSRKTRVLQYASYTFDVCLSEILSVLLFGGCVCVPSEQQRMENVVEAINEARVNMALLTPSVARLIDPTQVPGLEILALCGEAVTKADAAQWKRHVKLANSYGPSECGVVSTVKECILDDPTNIGRPTGSLCWVVDPDDHERLVPVGAVGELIIEGHIVANGYFNDEAKTAEAFIKSPAWLVAKRVGNGQEVSERVYKTGDLVQYNSDGSLKFIGRKDTQSKLHGQRMELGDVEQNLLSHSSIIKTVAVEIIEPEVRQKRQTLAAFFTLPDMTSNDHAQNTERLDTFLDISNALATKLQAIRGSLANALPSYMIPTLFIPVTAFPLSSSRKLDRRALRRMAAQIPATLLYRYSLAGVASRQAARNPAEKTLQRAWVEILGSSTEEIGRETSFFRAGGDSLSAMRLVSVARSKYGLVLTVADIFEHPRLCDMAAVMRSSHDKPDMVSSETLIGPFGLLPKDLLVDELVSMVATQCQVHDDSVLDIYPCTPLQEGLMAISIDKARAYLRQNLYQLPETLDVGRLKHAWEVVVAANPILRTRIVSIDSIGDVGCLQVVLADHISWLQPNCPKVQYLSDDLDLPITWGSPLSRFAVVAPVDSTDDDVYLVWTVHHALFDEWSVQLIMEQLQKAYHEETLPNVLPFNHYITYTSRSDETACASFWTEQMSGDIPLSFPQLPHNGYVPRIGDYHQRMIDISRSSGPHITTPTILRAAWALITGRYATTENIVFGASVYGRSAAVPGIERINGPTMATVPVKVYLGREIPIAGFIEQIQTQVTRMIAFEHWGLQNIARVSDTVPAFQNLFVVHLPGENDTETPLGLKMLESTNVDYHSYPLILECFLEKNAQSLRVKVSYDKNVVSYAPQLGTHFEWLVKQLISRVDDDSPLGTLDFCSPEDKSSIFGWNSEEPQVVKQCIHDLVIKNVRCQPDAPAVCSWDFDMTYAQLDDLSTELAKHLVFLGVKPEHIVPAIFEKSPWAIVAQLAVLKAGGVMCMLDPAHPRQRLEDHISTTEAVFILTSDTYSTHLQEDGRVILSVCASTMQSITEACCAATLPQVYPQNAAYVVFTSGTTGRPKANLTEHRAFVSSSTSYSAAMMISQTTRMLQYTAYAFDPYILETFSTLIQGGCVCLPKDEARTDPPQLISAILAMEVNFAVMTPSAARLLPKDELPTLETLVLGGEPMSPADRSWSRTVRLINVYGPSECSVVSTLNDSMRVLESDIKAIGKGVGSRCWIVEPSDHNLLAPVGCVGELLLESPGLSRGYLNDPDKTAEVFVDSPAWLRDLRPGSRMYKTGDLVRCNPADGVISFVGRKDMQLKVHGQRLEPQEIDHHLMAHEHVSIATVTYPTTGKFTGKLVATLSLQSITADSSANLRLLEASDKPNAARQLSNIQASLQAKVPSYMVPSVWAVVYQLPLKGSFKVDKNLITTWLETMNDETASEIMGLSSSEEDGIGVINAEMEGKLRDIVAKVLGLLPDQVLLGRSFISHGGDSITAIQTMARCRAENIAIKTKDILQSKSLRQLAERATVMEGEEHSKSNSTSDKSKAFGLTPIQKFYFDAGIGQVDPEPSSAASRHFNQSMLVRLTRNVTVEQLSRAIVAISGHHGMLRARFAHDGPSGGWTQRTMPTHERAFVLQHHTVNSLLDIDPIIAASQKRLDAPGGVVFVADYMDIVPPAVASEDRHQHQRLLFMAAHHLVIDLVSWRIILQDLEEFLATETLLSKGAVSFQAWSEMQERYAVQMLQHPKELASLFTVSKTDYMYWGIAPNTNLFGEMMSASFTLDVEATKALLGDCNETFNTKPEDLFISALIASFTSVFPDRDTPPVFCESHGRDCVWDSSIDLSSTVGWFTVLYPLQVKLATDQKHGLDSLMDAFRRTKDARARISAHVWPYFASRFLTRDGNTTFEDHWPMEILFNYVGGHQKRERDDAFLVPVPRHGLSPSPNHTHDSELHATADVGAQCRRIALFDIHVDVGSDGRAAFNFAYNQRSLHKEKIQTWISKYHDFLLEAADRLNTMSPEPTLSDFALMPHLTYGHLEQIQSKIVPALGLSSIVDIADVYPCGPAQKGIVISQARSTGTYNESFLYTVSPNHQEPVDLGRLEMAWQTVIARHDSLRTVIVEDTLATGEGYYQVVLRHWLPSVRHVEFIDSNEDDESAVLNHCKNLSAATPTLAADVVQKIPAHSMLFCRTATRTYVYLEISHSLMDASSMPVLLGDLATAYDNNCLSVSDSSKGPSYRDYIAHIRSLPMERSVDYWMGYLDGVEPCHIPSHHVDSLEQLDAPEVRSIPIELGASAQTIFDFCLRHGLLPASIFRLAWALVLHLYTGMDQVCFGSLASGRDAPIQGIENIIGLVCNVLVDRVDLDRNKTGVELLKNAQDGWSNSIEHQFVSLADVQHHHRQRNVDDSATTSTRRPMALFNTLLSLTGRNSGPRVDAKASRHSISFNAVGGDEGSEYDATVSIWPVADNSGFRGAYTYKVSHLTEPQAKTLAAKYSEAINRILEMGNRPLREWRLVGEMDQTHLGHTITGLSPKRDDSRSFLLGSFRRESISASNSFHLTNVQGRMRELWAEVLNKDAGDVSLEDSFIDQGGDSILAIKLVSNCRSAGLAISVANILRGQTFRTLCEPLEAVEQNKPTTGSNLQWKSREPFSSLGSLTNIDFVKSIVSPQVGTDAEGIEDVVEASPMQRKFIESSLLKGRGSTNYFTFHFKGHVDEARLRMACKALIAKHSILRTSFVAFKRHLFQVVLRSMNPAFRAHQCPGSQQERMASKWVKADQDEPVRLGQPIIRFLSLDGQGQSMLVMRISHAQYDGMSINILTNDLAALYQGRAIPYRPIFVDFTHAARESNEQGQGAQAYWRKLLTGATMTNVLSHVTPPHQSVTTEVISCTVAKSQREAHGFTFATILKAAWALVLMELSSSTDVVFGHLISGRNMSVNGLDADKILGPCLNLIPVRVQLQTPGTPHGARSVSELLQLVHDQQLAALPYETFGMDKMVEHTTNWPSWTRFSSVVQYQNLDGREEALEDFAFGEARCRLTAFQGQFDPADIVVLATPKKGSDDIDIALQFARQEGSLSRDFMAHILARLVASIEKLSSSPSPGEQQLVSMIPQSRPLIPLPVYKASTDRTAAAAAAGYSFTSMPSQIKDVVTQAWSWILEPLPEQRVRALDNISMSDVTPFYNIWGNFIAAAQFADFYSHYGVKVSVEDMIEHPSMLAQSVLLAKQLSVSIRPSPPSLFLLLFPVHRPWWISVL